MLSLFSLSVEDLDWSDDASTIESIANQVFRAGRSVTIILGLREAQIVLWMQGAVVTIGAGVSVAQAAFSFGFRIIFIVITSRVNSIAPHVIRAD